MSAPPTLEELADAYLDGDLPREEALAFERDLAVRPEAATALAEAVSLRELLAGLPPLTPPAGLAERIASALPLRKTREREKGDISPVWAALAGLSWTVRGPAVAALGAALPAAPASAGMAQLRWALGPLGAGAEAKERPRRPRPLWRRMLFGKGRP